VDGQFIRLKETLMTSFPELEILHADRKSSSGWTETQALESALLENPVTVLMYCLHTMNINVRKALPPTALATVVHAKRLTTEVGGATADVGGDSVGEGGVKDEVGGVGDEEEEDKEEEEEEEEDEKKEEEEGEEEEEEEEEDDDDDDQEEEEEKNKDDVDNAITIRQIGDWLKVNLKADLLSIEM